MQTWKGRFWSKTYGSSLVSGTIVINLKPITDLEKYETKAYLTYTGSYGNGQLKEADISIDLKNKVMEGNMGSQKLSYKIDTLSEATIRGTYTSQNPYDVGDFVLGDNPEVVVIRECSIM